MQCMYLLKCYPWKTKHMLCVLCVTLLLLLLYEYEYILKRFLTKRDPAEHFADSLSLKEVLHNVKYNVDVHKESAQSSAHDFYHDSAKITRIAIGLGITSRGIPDVRQHNIRFRLPFFSSLLSSLCKTTTEQYHYHIYVAFDADDPLFSKKETLKWFTDTFYESKKDVCSFVNVLDLHMVECEHTRSPAWAQNDAMMQAYLDNMDYFFRVNDDTYIKTPGWTEKFISTLQSFDPPNVGVVGPSFGTAGHQSILTYDFVHKTHIDIFGVYYPRIFTDWFADDWITGVYHPGRSQKVMEVKVHHTQQYGTRYNNQFGNVQYLNQQLDIDKKILKRYITWRDSFNRTSDTNNTTKTKVIAISVFKNNDSQYFGSIQNTILAKQIFSDWLVQVYVENPAIGCTYCVPLNVIYKLQSVGANVIYIPKDIATKVPPTMWPYLAIDNNTVEIVIFRDAESRLSERGKSTVDDWLSSASNFHCSRDHPAHGAMPIVPGLWGLRTHALRNTNSSSHNYLKNIMLQFLSQSNHSQNVNISSQADANEQLNYLFLTQVIWKSYQDNFMCHDSVSCTKWKNTKLFPRVRTRFEFLGRKFDQFKFPKNTSLEIGNIVDDLECATPI